MCTFRAEFDVRVNAADLELWQARLRQAGADTLTLPKFYRAWASSWAGYRKPCLNDLVRYIQGNRIETEPRTGKPEKVYSWRGGEWGLPLPPAEALPIVRRMKAKVAGVTAALRVPEADPRPEVLDVPDGEIPF
jgi:hypothetical protein